MSETPKKIPFLRLPLLAIQQVVSQMELQAMFFLSLTSTKAKNTLKISLLKNYIHMNCDFSRFSQITLKAPSQESLILLLEDSWNQENPENSFKIQNLEFNYFVLDPQQKIELKWGGAFEEGTKTLLTHLAEAFNLPKIELDVHPTLQPDVASVLLKHAKILNLPLMNIRLSARIPPEVYREFLNEGPRIIQNLYIFSESASNFSFRPESPGDFKLDLFLVKDAHWVHLEDYMECRFVALSSTTLNPNMYCLNSQRLNAFFKLWKGSECRLEHINVFCSRATAADNFQPELLNFEQMTEGLDGTNFTRTDDFQSLDIERQDGKKAKIKLSQRLVDFECY